MPQGKRLETSGHRGEKLPLSFWEQPQPSDHLALVFPGIGYHADLPVLYYPALQMFDSGADVLRLRYPYNENPAFSAASDKEMMAWLAADASAVLAAGQEQRAYTRITLVGKSLGTIAMATLLSQKPGLEHAACLWLTPVMNNPEVVRHLQGSANPGLLAIGTADHFYHASAIDALKSRPNLHCLVFPNADHSLEVAGNAQAAVRNMSELLPAIAALIHA